ncbi:MAG: hypothetical protein ACOC2W_03505 [bacterium]
MMHIDNIISEEFEKTQTDYPDIIGKKLKYTEENEYEFLVKKIIANRKFKPDHVVLYGNLVQGNREETNKTIELPIKKFLSLYHNNRTTWKKNNYQYGELTV